MSSNFGAEKLECRKCLKVKFLLRYVQFQSARIRFEVNSKGTKLSFRRIRGSDIEITVKAGLI